jgi:hypothetical protein
MAKSCNSAILDAALNYIKTNGTRLCICSSQPTTYTEATSTYKLADLSITSTAYTGPAAGAVSGRKITMNQQLSIDVDTTGSAQHVALVDVSSTALLYVTTCTAQTITSGNKVTVPAWSVELRDPS